MTTMDITWTPSPEALLAGFPDGVDPYADYNIPCSDDFADGYCAFKTLVVGAQRSWHAKMNNQAASALLSAIAQAKKANKPEVDKVAFLHDYRIKARAAWIAGEIEMRAAGAADVDTGLSDVERVAHDEAFKLLADSANTKVPGTYKYTKRDARSLGKVVSDGKTMGEQIARLLQIRDDGKCATVAGQKIWDAAEKTVADRKARLADAADPFAEAA